MRRLSTIVGRYRGQSSHLKDLVAELKGEKISLLKGVEDLKKDISDIKDDVIRVKAKCSELKRKLVKHVAREKLYVIANMLLFILLTIVIIF